jgi:hypothetical protein
MTSSPWCRWLLGVFLLSGCRSVGVPVLRTNFPADVRLDALCAEYRPGSAELFGAVAEAYRQGWRIAYVSEFANSFLIFTSPRVQICYERAAAARDQQLHAGRISAADAALAQNTHARSVVATEVAPDQSASTTRMAATGATQDPNINARTGRPVPAAQDRRSSAPSPTVVVHDDRPPERNWAIVGLSLTGPAARADTPQVCLKEARAAGIRVHNSAPPSLQVTVLLAENETRYLFADGRPEQLLGPLSAQSACRVALAAVLGTEKRVRTRQDDEPPPCRALGKVAAEDPAPPGPLPGSYAAALAVMQLAAQRLGGNYISLDPSRQVGTSVALSGQAYACPQAALPGPAATGPQPASSNAPK